MGFAVVVMLCFANPNPALGNKIPCDVFSKPVEATSTMGCIRHIPGAHRELLEAYGEYAFVKETRCLPLGSEV